MNRLVALSLGILSAYIASAASVVVRQRMVVDGVATELSEEVMVVGTEHSTMAPKTVNGYIFTHWTISTEQVFAARDEWGRAYDRPTFKVAEKATLTAWYVSATEDSDGDGVADGHEMYWYGNLEQNGASDTDGDGFSFALELANGTNPHMMETEVTGPIIGALGEEVVYNAAGYKHVVVRSEPAGTLLATSEDWVRPGATITTADYSPSNSKFVYWTMNGVPQRDGFGRALDSVSFIMGDEDVELVAATIDDAEMRQQLYWYGNVAIGMNSDTDGDGFTFAQEIANGTNPLMAEEEVEGPVAVSTGAQIIYDPNGRRTECVATVTGYTGVYDGAGHGIEVKVSVPDYGYTVSSSLDEFGEYTTTMPRLTAVGTNQRIYYRIDPDDSDEYQEGYGYGEVTLTPKTLGTDIRVTFADSRIFFDGSAKQPAVTVTDITLGVPLVAGIDYAIAYVDNVNVGLAKVVITGRGNYAGTIVQTFEIVPEWSRHELGYDDDNEFHVEAAAQWDGFLLDGEGKTKGLVNVQVGKPNRKTGVAKVTVTVQMAKGKQKFNGSTTDGRFVSADGRLRIQLGANGMTGTWGEMTIEGSRNLFKAKDSASKARVAETEKRWKGTYVLVLGEEDGYGTFSINVKSKGKASIKGTLASGVTVSATSQLLVGERECAMVVSWSKKGESLSFLVWFGEDGTIECANLDKGDSAMVGRLRDGVYLQSGAEFKVDGDQLGVLLGTGAMKDLLPDGMAINMRGTKFVLPKAGNVVVDKATGGINTSKLGSNPAGLKLSFAAKTGMVKGSFSAYQMVGGKIKKTSVTIKGAMLDGVVYGTATVKKVGNVPVVIGSP